MSDSELEAKIRVLEEKIKKLERLEKLESKVQLLEDIEEIKKLQRAYGFYLEHWMAEDLVDLFVDSEDSSLWIAAGKFQGKEAISRLFREGNKPILGPEFMHQVMQLSGVVHVNPDGKTAKGRWYGFGANAFPQEGNKVNPGWMNGVYEVNYVKENGKWKLKNVNWCMTFRASWTESFVDPAKISTEKMDRPYQENPALRPTGAPIETLYPSGFICPFHFANPVSGRKTVPEG